MSRLKRKLKPNLPPLQNREPQEMDLTWEDLAAASLLELQNLQTSELSPHEPNSLPDSMNPEFRTALLET
jgi:hypothetical protein